MQSNKKATIFIWDIQQEDDIDKQSTNGGGGGLSVSDVFDARSNLSKYNTYLI